MDPMAKIAEWLGAFLAPILKPIIMEVLNEWFKDKTFISKPNPAAQSMYDDLMRDSRLHDSAGSGNDKPKADHGGNPGGA